MSAVAVSSCGNYGLVGTAAGRVDRYNMQSGLHRGFYARQALRVNEIHCALPWSHYSMRITPRQSVLWQGRLWNAVSSNSPKGALSLWAEQVLHALVP